MGTSTELEKAVLDELFWDPRVKGTEVAVSADSGGRVTLRGTVGSLHQKFAARRDTKRVLGVTDVNDELKVRLMDEYRREDADIRGTALQALILDSQVPADRIDVKVEEGFLTLTGTVDWQYQRDEAERAVMNLIGVVGLIDEIEVIPTPSEPGVATRIRDALTRNAQIDASGIRVSTAPGKVTLEGTVASWAERDEAVDAAWAAPGVSDVHDRLIIAP
jgi:osmotically-inducible protein OsmY